MPENVLTQQEVETLAIQAGFTADNAKIAAAISMCEAPYTENNLPHSNFSAVGDIDLADATWGYSYGGMQIRSLRAHKGTGKIRDEDRLLDPLFNMRSARAIKLAAKSFRPWTTYTNGNYKAYLQDIFPPPPGGYVVVAGDSLSRIAAKASDGQWTWQDLARANGIHFPYTVYIGQILLFPLDTVGA